MEKELAKKVEYNQEKWNKIIASYRDSGQSVKEYCNEIGITPSTYYYYLKKSQLIEQAVPKLVPVNFAEAEAKLSKVSIHYYGATIQIGANDEVSLCAILSALKKV